MRSGSVGFSPVALRRYLQRAGYTVEEVADQIGLSRQAVSAWLGGRTTPSPQSLSRVAQLLEVTAADLTPGISFASMTLRDLRTRAGAWAATATSGRSSAWTSVSGANTRCRARSSRDAEGTRAHWSGSVQVDTSELSQRRQSQDNSQADNLGRQPPTILVRVLSGLDDLVRVGCRARSAPLFSHFAVGFSKQMRDSRDSAKCSTLTVI